MQPVLNAVIPRHITTSLCTGDDVVRAEGITGIGERYWEHGRTTALQGANHATEGRYDGPIQGSWKVFLLIGLGANKQRAERSGDGHTWGIPIWRPASSPEVEDDLSTICSKHTSRAFSRTLGRAAVGSLSSNLERISLFQLSPKVVQEMPRNAPNTREVEATSFPMIPTQSRLSANDTTPHLRSVQRQPRSMPMRSHLLINP